MAKEGTVGPTNQEVEFLQRRFGTKYATILNAADDIPRISEKLQHAQELRQ